MTERPRPPKPRARKGKRSRAQQRDKFRTLDGGQGDLLEDDLVVLDWVSRHVGSMGYPPSVREVQATFGYASTKAAYDVLHRLEAFGFLDVDPGVTRGIRLSNLPDAQDQGAARLRLWLAEAAALLNKYAADEPDAEAWLRKAQAATF
jgi:SOS-response transcriptional repressor LexA